MGTFEEVNQVYQDIEKIKNSYIKKKDDSSDEIQIFPPLILGIYVFLLIYSI